MTLAFTNNNSGHQDYVLFEGSANLTIGRGHPLVFRALDSKQIGGVGNWKEFERFEKRLLTNPQEEIAKNHRRMELMHSHGLMPDRFSFQ